jgi:hypothetical protein
MNQKNTLFMLQKLLEGKIGGGKKNFLITIHTVSADIMENISKKFSFHTKI